MISVMSGTVWDRQSIVQATSDRLGHGGGGPDEQRLMSTTEGRVVGSVNSDGHLVVPAEVVRAAGYEPETAVVFEVDAEGGIVVESLEDADAEESALLASVEEAIADPESAEPVLWEDVKQRNGL